MARSRSRATRTKRGTRYPSGPIIIKTGKRKRKEDIKRTKKLGPGNITTRTERRKRKNTLIRGSGGHTKTNQIRRNQNGEASQKRRSSVDNGCSPDRTLIVSRGVA